ncbi:MAG: hypothetical protein ABR915_00335, partial [Thermoguttaceae bacterium]
MKRILCLTEKVGWVDGHQRAALVGEPHQKQAKSAMVGLAALDPPYKHELESLAQWCTRFSPS